MKKTKLLTAIIGGSALLTSTPIVATSCTSDDKDAKESYYVVKGEKVSLPTTFTQADINNLLPINYTFDDGITRYAVFVNDKYVEADLITELKIYETDGIVEIPYYFLAGCTKLSKVYLKGVKVTSLITGYFIQPTAKNTILTDLSVPTLVYLPGMQETGLTNNFLRNFNALTNVDLSGFSDVTTIGTYFLSDSYALKNVDLTPLSKLKSVGGYFMRNCISLTSIDLTPLSDVQIINNYFLSGCTSLTNVDTINNMKSLTRIGTYFVSNTGIKSFKLTNLPELTQIGQNALSDNQLMTDVEISYLPKLQYFGQGLCSRSSESLPVSGVENITLKELPSLKKSTTSTQTDYGIQGNFLKYAPNLKVVNLGDDIIDNVFYADNLYPCFVTEYKTDDAYVNGITLNSANKSDIKTKFPDDSTTSGKYRK